MKQDEFINWINENGFSSIINVIGRDSKGDFLDITANRIYELFKINPNVPVQAAKAIDEIIQLKVKLSNKNDNPSNECKERVHFEQVYKELNPFNWQDDLIKRNDGSYSSEQAFYGFKYWMIRANSK